MSRQLALSSIFATAAMAALALGYSPVSPADRAARADLAVVGAPDRFPIDASLPVFGR